ncbi:PQQ-dependent dehydrogenase, methanol/ethanol family [Sphingomonas jatrophae]|uniref:Quinohemoprotein ethanol dehydrogenase n=1 Tax=Sphingomonas jatrophae TaxID=1166337 RepID=A0A1I6KCP6_9SPHN|nr:PQQ-dependent dehydrogenase, methanol/ethanol family [Sphingomonas jatrophae]SFR89012.1 quinohemoprotein ethanol dehydrogenase [Sphingomonas jatrophae]
MKLKHRVLTAAAAMVLASAAGVAVSQRAGTPDGADWAAYGRTSEEDHYSPLEQINAGNISQLGLVWLADVDTFDSFTAPLAVGGVLYFGVGNSVVTAMDAATGKQLWQYDPEVAKVAGHKMRAGWGTRGIAFSQGRVFTATRDGRLIALDAKSGKQLWSAMTLDPKDDAYISGPPWVAGDKVVIGFGGGDYGPVRGYVTAYDIATGKQAWRFYTVPGDPKKGPDGAASDDVMPMAAKTWTGEWWKLGGGGNVWHAMAYDAKYDRVYLGTGNGFPWNQKIRSPGGGDNLFLSSIVALDRKTGKHVWHYQVNPGNTWDFNNAMDIQLATLTIDGRPRDVLLHAPKNGFFYVLDREDGKPISAGQFAPANWASGIDLKTGRPIENPKARYPGGEPFVMFPSPTGAHAVETMSFNRKTGLVYIPEIEQQRVVVDPPNLAEWKYKPGMFVNTGLGAPPPGIKLPAGGSNLVAYDPVAAKVRWKVPQNGLLNGGTITTGGNLVFQGLNTGKFVAFAADTGKQIWSFDAQNGILGNAITYTVRGKQYVTVITGFRSSFANTPNWDYREQQRRVLTFALGGKAKLPTVEPVEQPIQDDPDFAVDAAKAKIGAGIYNQSCVICHGAGMIAGGAAPDLRKAGSPLDAEAFKAIVHGGALMERGMGKFDNLSDAELEGIRHYIRQRARETAPTTRANTVATPK